MRTRVRAFLLPLLLSGCARIHYETYAFERARLMTSDGTPVEVVASGTEHHSRSGRTHVERHASPYHLGIYVDRRSSLVVEVMNAELVGLQSGRVAVPTFSAPEPVGDGSLTVVAAAPEVALPFEDHDVRLRIRFGKGDDAVVEDLTGRFTTRYEESRASRLWESW